MKTLIENLRAWLKRQHLKALLVNVAVAALAAWGASLQGHLSLTQTLEAIGAAALIALSAFLQHPEKAE